MASSHIIYEKVATEDPESATPPHCSPKQSSNSKWPSIMMSILTHFLVLSVYSAIVFAVLRPKLQFGENPCRMANAEETQVYSPAREVLPLRVQVDERDIRGEYPTSPFAGNPGAETDGAWRHLLRGNNIRIAKDELVRLNRSSIQLADESGDSWGTLEVYHHLHCLKTIRQYLAIDEYDADKVRVSKLPGRVYPIHIEHCIEALRKHLMCAPDLTVYTHDWIANDPEPMPNHAVKRSCVDWKQLEEWTDERRFSLADRLIRRPDGTLWPDYV